MVTPILLLLIKVILGINKLLMNGYTPILLLLIKVIIGINELLMNGYTHIVVVNKGNTRY